MDLVTDLGLDILGVVTFAAGFVSLIKVFVKIFCKKKITRVDVGAILICILGFIPIIS